MTRRAGSLIGRLALAATLGVFCTMLVAPRGFARGCPTPTDGQAIVYGSGKGTNTYIFESTWDGQFTRQLSASRRDVIDQSPTVDPSGSRVAFIRTFGGRRVEADVWVMSMTGTAAHAVLRGRFWQPAWSPDGRRLALSEGYPDDLHLDLYDMQRDKLERIHLPRRLAEPANPSWSSDGKHLAFSAVNSWSGNVDIFVIDLPADRVTRVTTAPRADISPSWSWLTGVITYLHITSAGVAKQVWNSAPDGRRQHRIWTSDSGLYSASASNMATNVVFQRGLSRPRAFQVSSDGTSVSRSGIMRPVLDPQYVPYLSCSHLRESR